MPNFIQKRFTNPETFRRMPQDLLVAWLRQSEGYFSRRGLLLPGSPRQLALGIEGVEGAAKFGTGGKVPPSPWPSPSGEGTSGIDYDGLVRAFMEPTPDMPAELIDGLHLVHEMGRARRMDSMLAEAQSSGLELGLGEEATPEDVAVRLLLLDPRLLEDLHNRQEVTRPRGFEFFSTDANPVPAFPDPTLEQLRTLEKRLDAFYVAWRRGTGTRVFAYSQRKTWQDYPEWLFLVRHGAPFRREEAMEKGEPTSVLYRPRRYAVLKYDTGRGEMGVYCGAQREQEVLLRLFGACLFGRKDFFPGGAKFDLRPLVDTGRACLACQDVPGIEEVKLTHVEFFHRREPWRRVTQQAEDIFTLIEGAHLQWPEEVDEITKATFTVRLWRQKRPRRVTIVPCNRALYSGDEESPLLERWMEARGLVRPVSGGKKRVISDQLSVSE